MTLAEIIRKAVTDDDAKLAGRIAERLRGDGFKYDAIRDFFKRAAGIDAPEFDALMYEADNQANRS